MQMSLLETIPKPESKDTTLKAHIEDIERLYRHANYESSRIDANDYLLRAANVIRKVLTEVQYRDINYIKGFSLFLADKVLNEAGIYDSLEIHNIKQNINPLFIEYEQAVKKSRFIDFINTKIKELERQAEYLNTTKNQLNKRILFIQNLIRENYKIHYDIGTKKLIPIQKNFI